MLHGTGLQLIVGLRPLLVAMVLEANSSTSTTSTASIANFRRMNEKDKSDAFEARPSENPPSIIQSHEMSFFVDIVTEDSFYENLTLGVVKILENSPCVKNVEVERRLPCDGLALSTWEQRHCCLLPEDLRNFYTSVDGFLLTWNLDISGEEFPVGRMEIDGLGSLKRFIGNKEQPQADTENESQNQEENPIVIPTFGARCKLFEIGRCGDSKVFLTYQARPEEDQPGIWLHCIENNQWYHLADSFTKYFRMMLVYLGLPLWQYCAAGLLLPTWVEQVYFLVGPHLLSVTGKPSETISTALLNDGPTNTIDPAIFRAREGKHSKKK